MSAGTITLANNSNAVAGTGTSFTTELAVGDFIVVTTGGVTYTLPVKSIESNTALTLARNYNGPAVTAGAWTAMPRDTMNRISAQIAADTAYAIRQRVLEIDNWYQLLEVNGEVTIKMADGSSYTGPSWLQLADSIKSINDKFGNGALTVANGGTGETTPDGSSANLGFPKLLGNSIQPTATSLAEYRGTQGSGGEFFNMAATNLNTVADMPTTKWSSTNKAYGWGAFVSLRFHKTSASTVQMYFADENSNGFYVRQAYGGNAFRPWACVLTDKITTLDSNGFVKSASPIIKVFGSGEFETNGESEGAAVERVDVGVYRVSGVLGMNADRAWGGNGGGVEVPKDINGQPRVWVDYDIDPDGSIILRTYHRTHPDAPAFARNLIGTKDDVGNFTETVLNGEPIDIPDDVFISVRVEMPADSVYNLSLLDRQRMELAE